MGYLSSPLMASMKLRKASASGRGRSSRVLCRSLTTPASSCRTSSARSSTASAPPIQATVFQHPRGDHYTYFRVTPPSFGGVFTLIKNHENSQYYVVLILEFTQGLNDLLLTPPCGGLEQQDHEFPDPFAACAQREFENETGIRLRCVVPITSSRVGVGVSGRQDNQRIHAFWGEPLDPPEFIPQKLDPTEHHAVVLMSLDEWLKYLQCGLHINETSYTMTMLALLRYPKTMLPVMIPRLPP